MTPLSPIDQTQLAAEMRMLAQSAILDWFADFIRIQLATQSSTQSAFTSSMIQDGLESALQKHETQAAGASDTGLARLRSSLFKDAYTELRSGLMDTVRSGLTKEEAQQLSA